MIKPPYSYLVNGIIFILLTLFACYKWVQESLDAGIIIMIFSIAAAICCLVMFFVSLFTRE